MRYEFYLKYDFNFEKAERDIVCRENIRLGANILAE